MDVLALLSRLLAEGDLAKIADASPHIKADLNRLADDMTRFAADLKRLTADAEPIIDMLQKLKE